jgi:HD-like signal output (HDOD) protein
MTTASELVAGIRDLVMLPESYLRIQSLLRDPSSGVEEFARVVQGDPALAARVLRVANSAFFGVSRKVETITLAISLMGMSRLHDLVLSTAVIGSFGTLPIAGINQAVHWRRSIHVGILARMLADECGIVDSERLFVSGLLHDIGHLVMGARSPQELASALEHSRARSIPLASAERELLGFHYGDVGASLMKSWSFPDSLQEICQFHVNPQRAQKFPRECSLVHVAQHFVHATDPDPESLPFVAPLAPVALELASVEAGTAQRVATESFEHLIEAVDLLMQKRAA